MPAIQGKSVIWDVGYWGFHCSFFQTNVTGQPIVNTNYNTPDLVRFLW